MRHKSNGQKIFIDASNLLLDDETSFSFRPRFSKHKNFYTKKPLFEYHYVTPTQKHAKEILDKICHVNKKALITERPESSFQKRKEFSVDQCLTTRGSMQRKQIRIKSINRSNIQNKLLDQDWLAFVLD
ncbi:unnamed protein product (macronuclear) [Paramecium tetraurelia]|uniref:Uncharacterized protein n=2 Tax=Paramecium TaxID=5884 RepID=A0C8W9_PARTE|nr:uncharacterized protein GSPATT00036371001 [Paramecium tetraurelia]CAD8211537.1 unnamed protein product [Paramecium octaurelia]CAK67236.1 unnamed protein product [Paramecium tetraurelia]|eukprot:XP_001434633.1 hypothetical protein (macronuclear) [Paramecium tetraurelia strain d4-2]